jgi:predicted transcriptional regulator
MKNKVTPKDVDHALAELCSFGMVDRTTPTVYARKHISGRPPKFLYSAKSPRDIMKLVEQRIDSKREKLFEVFGALENFEDARNTSTGGNRN